MIKRSSILTTRGVKAACLVLIGLGLMPQAFAAETTKVVFNEDGKLVAKKDTDLKPVPTTQANGKVVTDFAFHPVDKQSTDLIKTKTAAAAYVINPNPFTHTYAKDEEHGTTGKATYQLAITTLKVKGQDSLRVGGKITTEVTVGLNKNAPVSINATLMDPFVFSDTADGHFPMQPDGLDYLPTLEAGTSLPLFDNHDVASGQGASIVSRARVVAGSNADPDAFWSGPAGDFYRLEIHSAPGNKVDAELYIPSALPGFTIDLRDAAGTVIDPADKAALTAIEEMIEASFVDGMLSSDVADFLTVGFTPDAGVENFTAGVSKQVIVSGVETPVPEPGVCVLVLVGLGLIAVRHGLPRRTQAVR